MYYKRTLAKTIQSASSFFKVVLLIGPRQVGKSTLFAHIKEENRAVITLDDAEIALLAQEDPALFFERFKPPLLIDEVQKAPNLFLYIKKIVDTSDAKGQFWLTGSQQFHLMKNVSESLAGRVAILDLQGFSQSEKAQDDSREPFTCNISFSTVRPVLSTEQTFEAIVNGSFPQVFDGTPVQMFYSSYIRTYLERDVREIVNITNEHTFLKFLKVVAARTAQVLNYNNIARDVDISVNTAKSWVSVLETLGIIYLLPPYFNNLTKRATKTPKIYFLDTGLCSYLAGIHTGELAISHSMSGALFETYVVSEILKSYWHNGIKPQVYFYRDTAGKEIDLLLDVDGAVHPIEIKQTSSPTPAMVKNFDIIPKNIRGTGALICLTTIFIPMNKEVNIIPVSYI